jgi:hypothetical protein
MRMILKAVVFLAFGSGIVFAQQPTFHDALLDKLAGTWLLQGTIAGKPTTHDVTAEWVVRHQYLRIHEVSHEKNAEGQPEYEAMVFVGWDQNAAHYVCIWLDTYGGMNETSLGRAKRDGDVIPFLFKDKDSTFHTQFIYHRDADNWEWRMDSEEKGAMKPFARVTLKRK